MKALTILSAVMITVLGCNCQKATTSTSVTNTETENNKQMEQKMPVFECEAMTRGFYKKITIEGTKVTLITSRDANPITGEVTASDLELLNSYYKKVDVAVLPNLKAPSEDRFHDGATIDVLRIIKDNETFRSSEFDGGNPPAEIKNIVETILSIAKKLEK